MQLSTLILKGGLRVATAAWQCVVDDSSGVEHGLSVRVVEHIGLQHRNQISIWNKWHATYLYVSDKWQYVAFAIYSAGHSWNAIVTCLMLR